MLLALLLASTRRRSPSAKITARAFVFEPARAPQPLDLTGRPVMPGLVGMHDHLFYPMGGAIFGEMAYSFPRLYLAAGVTTIRTAGSIEPYTDIELKKAIDAGKVPGPP